jgi:response regulator RpfG family c-di-GMP phosphodiesterase
MDRVLLQVKKKRDRRRLEDWLSKSYHIVLPNQEHPLQEEVDLVIIDGPSLKELRSKVKAVRKAQEPVFLPFLLLTIRRSSSVPARHLGRVVDDLLIRPLNEKELVGRSNLKRSTTA